MKIITVYSLKGGTGKSTISILIAELLQKKGYKVVLIDSDTQQQTVSDYITNTNSTIDCYQIDNTLTKSEIKSLDADYIIIDGTPRADKYAENMLQLSDLLIMPIQPTQIAVSALLQPNHLSILKTAKKIGVVLNFCSQHNLKEIKQTREILKQNNLTIISQLSQRKAFSLEYDKLFLDKNNSKAKNEIGYTVDKIIEILHK